MTFREFLHAYVDNLINDGVFDTDDIDCFHCPLAKECRNTKVPTCSKTLEILLSDYSGDEE